MKRSHPVAVYDGAVQTARWILRALAAMALVIPAVALTPLVAHAGPPGLVDVTITANSSPVLDLSDPEQVVELRGTIINTSTSRIQFTVVNFWKSTGAIDTELALEDALDSASNVPEGERQEPFAEESGHVQIITQDDWFEPGARANFTVSATVGELEFPTDDAAYLVGVHVRGITEGIRGNRTVGRGRILVTATTSPLPFSEVVELTAGPQRTMSGDFVDDTLAGALATDLDDLLTLAEDSGATILLDPMLLMDARALAEEHTVGGEAAPADDEAAAWAKRVDALIGKQRVLRLPWGAVDLPRAQATGHLEDVVGWADDALTDSELREIPLAANLESSASPDLVKELGALGFTTVLARNTSGGSIGPIRVVRISDPHQPGMGPGGKNSPAQQLGRRVADELLAETPPTYLVDTADEERDVAALPTHHEVVPIAEDDDAITFTATEPIPRWEALTDRIEDLLSDAAFRLELTGIDDLPQLERVAVVAMSSTFETEAAALAWLDSGQVTEVDPSKVTIGAASQFVMASRTNNFPVSITNGLDRPVELRLVFVSESPQRIDVPATDFVTVGPGENLTLTLAPEASSNSVVTVEGHMETTDGTRFGDPVSIEITATGFGRVGWIIVIISGAVVLGGTFWRIRAVQAERLEEDT